MQVKFRRQIARSGGSFQVAIPPEVMEMLGLHLHDKILVEPVSDGIEKGVM